MKRAKMMGGNMIRDLIESTKTQENLVVRKVIMVPRTVDICPHCNEEIGEKSLSYNESTKEWRHRGPCYDKGPIVFPESENRISDATLKALALGVKKWMSESEVFKKKINETEWKKETSNLYQHAKRELELAKVSEDLYGQMLPNAVLEIVEIFAKQGHSGMSAAYTIALLEKLLRFEHLTAITDNPEDWVAIKEEMIGRKGVYQCKRNPALFSEDGGKTYYSVDDKDREIHNSEPYKKD